MKKNLEEIFKESLGKHEMPYDPAAWNAVKNQLPTSSFPYAKIGVIAAAIAVIATVSVILFTETNAEVTTTSENTVTPALQNEDQTIIPEATSETVKQSDQSTISPTNTEPIVPSHLPVFGHSNDVQTNNNLTERGNESANLTETSVEQDNQPAPKPDKWLSQAQYASIISSKQSVCQGETVRLHIEKLPENTLVEWQFANGETKFGTLIVIEPSQNEAISVKLVNKLNTKSTHELPVQHIDVLTPQEFMISVTEEIKNTKPYFILENKNHQIQQVNWSMDLVKSKGNLIEFYLVDQGSYTYNVTGTDQNGCKIDKKGTVILNKPYNLFAPTGFSPNGDGINETFIPVALLSRDVEFKMTIVDRSGNTVYETIDKHQPWDGTTLNGQRAQIGNNFMWVVTLINEEGLPEKYSGTIVIVK